MPINTDAFLWKPSKDKSRKWKTNIPRKQSFFPLLYNCLFQRCFKESITPLYDHIENVVGTKFQNYYK